MGPAREPAAPVVNAQGHMLRSTHIKDLQHSLPHWLFWLQSALLSSLQAPMLLQVLFFGWDAHSGSNVPGGTGLHVPIVPGRLHAWHFILHDVLQQTPSTQVVPPEQA